MVNSPTKRSDENSRMNDFSLGATGFAMPSSNSASKKRRSGKSSSKRNDPTTKSSSRSSSIPLPKSHIHRTPSELQLADDMRTAEYQDVRMYARIVVGMQSQCLASGYVHPLSRKSLQGVIQTKQADIDEEEKRRSEGDYGGTKFSDYDHGWDVSYIDEDRSLGGSSPAHARLEANGSNEQDGKIRGDHRRDLNELSLRSSLTRPSSNGSVSTLSHQAQENNQDEDDDCVFSLEL